MPNYQDDMYQYDPNDPYAIDIDKVVKENTAQPTNKVNWFNLPDAPSTSVWRILPWTQKRTFFKKIAKHFNVPGVKGALTCPRSFVDPVSDAKYDCAMDEQRWVWEKSKDPAEVALAKLMRGSVKYYVNAINIDNPQAGVGVLSLPYDVWKVLFDWLTTPGYQLFCHPAHGRNVIIKRTLTNAVVPGTNQKKSEYTVTPDAKEQPLEDMNWMEATYDLETIVGIPTYDFTKICLQRLVSGDPNYGQDQIKGGAGYVKRLSGETDFNFTAAPEDLPPAQLSAESVNNPQTSEVLPAFATVPTSYDIGAKKTETTTMAPTTLLGSDGHRLCFGRFFDENNKVCLKCPELDDCELICLKTARAAKKSGAGQVKDDVHEQMKVLLHKGQ